MGYHGPMRPKLLIGLLGTVVGAGCGFDWDGLDPRVSATSTTTSTAVAGGAAGGSATGGAGGADGTGGGATGGGGGAGGAPTLRDDGVLARFYLDDGGPGQESANVVDTIDDLSLPITYEGTSPTFVASSTGLGLRWDSQTTQALASGPLAGGLLQMGLNGAQQLTIELVLEVDATPNAQMRALQVSTLNNVSGDVGVQLDPNTGRVAIDFNDTMSGSDFNGLWEPSLLGRGRVVLHVLFDTTQAEEADRAMLFIDGVRSEPGLPGAVPVQPITQGDSLVVSPVHFLAIGNREANPARPFPGTIFYAALYQGALTEAAIQNNVAVLSSSDDAP